MRKMAVIPARSGSKGLKDKNIMDLCGKPLMAYSIEAAVEAGIFDKIIVSTDSEQYGKIAIRYGAEVMYRGEELSNDRASTFAVLEDLLGRMEGSWDYFMLLQPTSPMRTSRHIREAASLFESKMGEFDFLVSVTEADHPKALVNPIGEDGSLEYFDIDFSSYRRQKYADYVPNGAIFIGKMKEYLEQKHFFGKKSLAYKMTRLDSVDIDKRIDYEFACLCMKKRLGKGEGRKEW